MENQSNQEQLILESFRRDEQICQYLDRHSLLVEHQCILKKHFFNDKGYFREKERGGA